ncbi:MAG: hypothetical protein IKP68_03210 [Clostridia bacterium]|nr:hypothetical protein [Clostridia bacterium]
MIFKKRITSLEKLTLSLSGMCEAHEYEIVTRGETATVTRYGRIFGNDIHERKPETSVVLDTAAVIKTLNGFGVYKWDGFNGKRPRGLLDGTDFTLCAAVNGGKEITAHGSQNFPSGFHDLCSWFYEVLKNADQADNKRDDHGNN